MTSKLLKQKKELMKAKKLTKSEINSFKKLFNSMRWIDPRFNNNLKPECKNDFENIQTILNHMYYSDSKSYLITKEQTKQGIDYLKRFCFKVNGSLRKGVEDSFNEYCIDIIKNFSKFRFVGFYEINHQYHNEYMPAWRTYDKKGNYFDYICAHWGKPEILNYSHKTYYL